jgi:methylenetetrahydrofolate dehydrogenase (NADP+)/methenyltetrahydrofolate cyclohydrolase
MLISFRSRIEITARPVLLIRGIVETTLLERYIEDLPGKVMDGRLVAEKVRLKIRQAVEALAGFRVVPCLATIVVGDSPTARAYLSRIHSACDDVGIKPRSIQLAANSSQSEICRRVVELNEDKAITGILVQLPLPKGLDDVPIISSISPQKDVDGVQPVNVGLLAHKRATLVSCTPKGVLVLLHYFGVKISGRHAVIINRSNIVGRPLSQMLLNEDATVTVCHSKTVELASITGQADLLVSGIGHRSEFTVGVEMIKRGATVIDIGTSIVDGRIKGDVDFEAAISVADYVTPVPGGVGPMTNAMLLYNTLLATCLQRNIPMDFNLDELTANEHT